MSRTNRSVRLTLTQLEARECPTSLNALGVNGINMLTDPPFGQNPQPLEGLTGSGVRLAMIEGGRPGLGPQRGKDGTTHSSVLPTAVFEVDQPGTNNKAAVLHADAHATQVASVMIGQILVTDDPLSNGAARNAELLASSTMLAPFANGEVKKRAAELKAAAVPPLSDKAATEAAQDELFLQYVGRSIRHLATVQVPNTQASPTPRAYALSLSVIPCSTVSR